MDLSTYTTTQLAAAFNTLTRSNIKKFENRQKAEARVSAALSSLCLREDKIPALASGTSPEEIIRKEIEETAVEAPAADPEVFDEDDVPAFLKKDRLSALAEVTPEPAPAQKKARPTKAEKKDVAPRGKTKNEIMIEMVMAEGGATEAEICEAIGWKACLVTLRRACQKAGVTLRGEREGRGQSRWFGTRDGEGKAMARRRVYSADVKV